MKLERFDEKDFLGLLDFMSPIWYKTYSFLPKKQVTLLIRKYFSEQSIARFREGGYVYMKLCEGETVGVVVYCEKDGTTYLDKLYLAEDARGRGYPEFVFARLLELGRDITLNVNQANERAVACYKKNGFEIESEELIDLGGGMVNKDYKMRLRAKIST